MSRSFLQTIPAVERIWHMQDIHGQILALAFSTPEDLSSQFSIVKEAAKAYAVYPRLYLMIQR